MQLGVCYRPNQFGVSLDNNRSATMETLNIREAVLLAIAVVIALTAHESAHAWVAARLGDNTATRNGRVTINPLKHIDPFGTVVLPLALIIAHSPFIFGYAKPVPVNWKALRKPKRDMALVAAAGPAANLALGFVLTGFLALIHITVNEKTGWIMEALAIATATNFVLAFFNMIPIPPLDGSKVFSSFLPERLANPYLRLGRYGFLPLLAALVILPLLALGLGALFR